MRTWPKYCHFKVRFSYVHRTCLVLIIYLALQLANEQRNAYGLRYNDYARYRKHCANRTHRLRSTLKMTHGKGREFKKLPPVKLENIKDG